MKVVFKISPVFPVKHELAKEITRFCIKEAIVVCKRRGYLTPKQITLTMVRRIAWTRSGRAERNSGKLIPHQNRDCFISVKHINHSFIERYHRYKDSPTCLVDGTVECFVHLLAHELGHCICGFSGLKVGEFCCENFASRTLEAWRLKYQDNACMI